MSAPAVAVKDVRLTYANGVRALDGVSLEVAHGEFVSIIGPNGSGKSSLLRAIAGLQAADNGELLLDGQAVRGLRAAERARRIALVPQALTLLPGYSVEDFVLMGRYAHLSGWRLFTRADREVVRESLQRVDALEFRERFMDEMSGGERQRALIARALAQEARTILLDEPTSALDLKHQLMVYELIYQMRRDTERTVVVVTHDLNLASQFSDRLVLMLKGKIVQQGSPAEVLVPEVLERVYETTLAYGSFPQTAAGKPRPWVLPWGRGN